MTSKQEDLSNQKLFIVLSEIIQGYSERVFRDSPVFIKHFGQEEKTFYYRKYQEFFDKAVKAGLKTEEQALDQAISDEMWSKKDESEIAEMEKFIETMRVTKKNLFKERDLQQISRQIEEEYDKLQKKIIDRKEALGKTAEEYAESRSNSYFIQRCLFKDSELKNFYFTPEEFEEISYQDLTHFTIFFNSCMEDFKEGNIQKITLADFFNQYYLVSDYPTEFFGKPMSKLTDLQTRLIIYTKIFKGIFEQNDNIPEVIKKDPEALLEYVDKSKAQKKFESKTKSKTRGNTKGAEMVFGATNREIDEKDGITLKDAMKDKNMLTMEELMKIHGEA
jgi:hypothetical protein